MICDTPFLLSDPRRAAAVRTGLSLTLYGRDSVDDALIVATPWMSLPAVSVGATALEKQPGYGLFTLSWPYLPADIWMRRPGETHGSYQTRLIIALLRLDQVDGLDDDAGLWYRHTSLMPTSDDDYRAYWMAFMGGDPSDKFEHARRDMLERAKQAWPDGYPIDDQLTAGRIIAGACRQASMTLSVMEALRALDAHDSANAVDLVKTASVWYGDGYPQARDPHALRAWAHDRTDTILDACDLLESLGLDAGLHADRIREALR